MGEKDVKPNLQGNQNQSPGDANNNRHAGGGRRNRRYQNNNNNKGSHNTSGFVSRNKGIEHNIFDNTGTNDAALFNHSLNQIADYLIEKLEHGKDVSDAIRNITPVIITIPPKPTPLPDPSDPTKTLPVTETMLFKWKDAFSRASKCNDAYISGMDKAYIIIINQCSPSLKAGLEASPSYSMIRQRQNPIDLLKLIQGLCCSYDSKTQSVMATVASHKRLYMHYQKDGVDNHTYHREFLAFVETIETYGGVGAVGVIPIFLDEKIKTLALDGLIKDPTNPTDEERSLAVSAVKEEYLGALMLSGSNRDRFNALRVDLQNQFGYGNDLYPESPDQCLSLLNRWTVATPARPKRNEAAAPAAAKQPNEALVFAQDGDKPKSSSKDDTSHKSSSTSSIKSRRSSQKSYTSVMCKLCGQMGHSSAVCPERKPPPAQIHAMEADDASEDSDDSSILILAQVSDAPAERPPPKTINRDYLLLDSQSTVDLFSNPNHVSNIRQSSKPIRVHCNNGTKFTTKEADFGSTVTYFDETGIANVLSLFKLGQKYPITYDSRDRGGVFQVHTPRGVVEFKPTPHGLYALHLQDNPDAAYLLVTDGDPPEIRDEHLYVNTVRQNYEGYTKKQIQHADRARRLMAMVGAPTERDFQGMVRHNYIKDCPVTNEDVVNAHNIFGPDLINIRGKTVRRKPDRVVTDYVEIPKDFFTRHNHVTLVADIMFVNGIPFLVSASRSINLITIEHAPQRTASKLGLLLNRIIRVYAHAGFQVQTILMDNEFEKVRDYIPTVNMNTPAAG